MQKRGEKQKLMIYISLFPSFFFPFLLFIDLEGERERKKTIGWLLFLN